MIDLNVLPTGILVELYNLASNKSIKKFENKEVAIKRLIAALDETGQEIFEHDGEYDIRPIPTKQIEVPAKQIEMPLAQKAEERVANIINANKDDELTIFIFKGPVVREEVHVDAHVDAHAESAQLVNEAIEASQKETVDIHAASNKLIGDAIANNSELAEIVKPKTGVGKATETVKAPEKGRRSPLTGRRLTLVRPQNPKRADSRTFTRYEVYRECKTSDDFIRICEERGLGTRREILSDLSWDSSQHFIKLEALKAK